MKGWKSPSYRPASGGSHDRTVEKEECWQDSLFIEEEWIWIPISFDSENQFLVGYRSKCEK